VIHMIAVVWSALGVFFLVSIGFFFDARSDRRDLKNLLEQMNAKIDQQGAETRATIAKLGSDLNARIDQTNTRIDQVIMNMATKEDVTELRGDSHRVEDKTEQINTELDEVKGDIKVIRSHLGLAKSA